MEDFVLVLRDEYHEPMYDKLLSAFRDVASSEDMSEARVMQPKEVTLGNILLAQAMVAFEKLCTAQLSETEQQQVMRQFNVNSFKEGVNVFLREKIRSAL